MALSGGGGGFGAEGLGGDWVDIFAADWVEWGDSEWGGSNCLHCV